MQLRCLTLLVVCVHSGGLACGWQCRCGIHDQPGLQKGLESSHNVCLSSAGHICFPGDTACRYTCLLCLASGVRCHQV